MRESYCDRCGKFAWVKFTWANQASELCRWELCAECFARGGHLRRESVDPDGKLPQRRVASNGLCSDLNWDDVEDR